MTASVRATFDAELPPVEAPGRSELLGRFVPTAIRRPPRGAKIPNPYRLTLIGLMTAGFVPAWWLVQRAGRIISLQSQHMDLAVDLMEAASTDKDDINTLREAARAVTPTRLLMRAAGAALVVGVVSAVASLGVNHWTTDALRRLWFNLPPASDPYALTSLIALSAAFLLAMAAMNRHIVSLQQFALAFNGVTDATPELAVESPGLVWGIRPVHLVLGLAMAAFGMIWGLPMMLAWAAFGSMTFRSTHLFRIQLADRLQAISGTTPVAELSDHCDDPQCRAPMPFEAQYCPRCGRAVNA